MMRRPPLPTLTLKMSLRRSAGRFRSDAKGRSARSKVLVKSISTSWTSGGGGRGGTTIGCSLLLGSPSLRFFFLTFSSLLNDSRRGLCGKIPGMEFASEACSTSLALASCSAYFLDLDFAADSASESMASCMLFGSWCSFIFSFCKSHWQHTKSLFLLSLFIAHSRSSFAISMFTLSSFIFSKLCRLFSLLLLVWGLLAFSLGLNTL
mmetsp:Transcript_10075/g.28556  ORF Transcript_10075/g.28556 Transcript_10075/m.28556 type:complete len:207 (-) Transcript_10075:1125-1745(-)